MFNLKNSSLTFVVLLASILVVSTAFLMIRVAQSEQVPSLAIAFWRLAIASALLCVFCGFREATRHELVNLPRSSLLLMLASGGFLAVHFATWIASLAYTSVASSTALVSTNPVWLALFSWLVLKEPPDRWIWFGVTASLIGSIIIFSADANVALSPGGATSTLGNGLALAGSVAVCGYLLIGRRLAAKVSISTYVTVVFSAAAAVLLLIALGAGSNLTGFGTTAWLSLVGLALGPQLIGHSGISWSLRHLAPTLVAVAILGEPIGSAVLAWWLLGERIGPVQFVGLALLMMGIFLAARSATTRKTPTAVVTDRQS